MTSQCASTLPVIGVGTAFEHERIPAADGTRPGTGRGGGDWRRWTPTAAPNNRPTAPVKPSKITARNVVRPHDGWRLSRCDIYHGLPRTCCYSTPASPPDARSSWVNRCKSTRDLDQRRWREAQGGPIPGLLVDFAWDHGKPCCLDKHRHYTTDWREHEQCQPPWCWIICQCHVAPLRRSGPQMQQFPANNLAGKHWHEPQRHAGQAGSEGCGLHGSLLSGQEEGKGQGTGYLAFKINGHCQKELRAGRAALGPRRPFCRRPRQTGRHL